MKIIPGTKLDVFDLFNQDNKIKVGDILKKCSDNKFYLVIETDPCEDPYYSSIELYPLPYEDSLPDSKYIISNILDNEPMKRLGLLYKESDTISYCDFNDSDENIDYEYITHINLKLVTYLTIDPN